MSGPEANEVHTSVPSGGEITYQNQAPLLLGIIILVILIFGKHLVSLNRPPVNFFRDSVLN